MRQKPKRKRIIKMRQKVKDRRLRSMAFLRALSSSTFFRISSSVSCLIFSNFDLRFLACMEPVLFNLLSSLYSVLTTFELSLISSCSKGEEMGKWIKQMLKNIRDYERLSFETMHFSPIPSPQTPLPTMFFRAKAKSLFSSSRRCLASSSAALCSSACLWRSSSSKLMLSLPGLSFSVAIVVARMSSSSSTTCRGTSC
ncbi:hypothetical protein JZ751_009177 [Albula glossodonta]|uniref:Uncharacterized protein n=1 Tax=Albula glossodonta TaxID=121402 RepID=A0A8T2N0Y3_9TELE|nr:hypothetical protein JZ751_009177 [Albula glossodonta]